MSAAAPDWQELNQDLLALIAKKITLIEDFMCFKMVCRSWDEAASLTNLQPQIPWLVLAPEDDGDHDDNICSRRQIYSPSKENLIKNTIYVPSDRRCIGLNHGWMLTISKSSSDLNLVQPLSGSEIKLPNMTTIDEYDDNESWPTYSFITTAALSGNPSSSDFSLMIIHSCGLGLGYWRPGDTCWTTKFFPNSNRGSDMIYYKDQFSVITETGRLWSCAIKYDCDVRPKLVFTKVMKITSSIIPNAGGIRSYIVESSSPNVLLLVVRKDAEEADNPEYEEQEPAGVGEEGIELYENSLNRYGLVYLKVYELDLLNGGSPRKIMNLGDRAIFVGQNTSISFVASQFTGIKPNHIYFTDDCSEKYTHLIKGGGSSMGSYCLEDAKVMHFQVGESLSRISPPFWFIPAL